MRRGGWGLEDEGGVGLRGQLKGAPGILGRRAQGEAGGNRGRDRRRALREEEDDADGWARAGRGGARAPRAAARAGARGGPGRVTRGRPGSGLGRGSGRARWAGLGSWAGLVFYLSRFFSFLFLNFSIPNSNKV